MSDEAIQEDDVHTEPSNGEPKETPEEEEILEEHVPEQPVKVRDKRGAVRTYYVREMDEAQMAQYMAAISSRKPPGKSRTAGDYEGIHADLICHCLYDDKGNRVPKAMIRLWGAKILNRLFDRCQRINGLTEEVKAREGKG